ncbi:MAG TPA: metallophosphoesterase [archaeon]|nr:metallophosphoesterase [archaeon]
MKLLLLSDIHANLEAMEAVFSKTKNYSFDKIVSLGDQIDYGANPNEVIALLKEKKAHCILGNHEYILMYPEQLNWFNSSAQKCSLWTKENLSKENMQWIEKLPGKFIDKENKILGVHGTPFNPIFEYIDAGIARLALKEMNYRIFLTGHSHLPGYIFEEEKQFTCIKKKEITYDEKKILITVPSCGQPRDEDPRTGYCVLDTDEKFIKFERISYDIEKAAKKIREAGLPEIEAERLFSGF